MAAEGGNNIVWFTYTGAEDIPREVTHISVLARVILERAFYQHPSIVEVICHEDVEKVESKAFYYCPSLRRVIMPGVKIVGGAAFIACDALADVQCGKLEIIKGCAFGGCSSLRSIKLPSARIVERHAFIRCKALVDVIFSNKLERIEGGAFIDCTSLERITLPLKDGLITEDNIFQGCYDLMHADLVEGEVYATVAALQLEEWKNEMNEEINSINQILPTAPAGEYILFRNANYGEKARAIQTWVRSVLGKIIHYQAEHQRFLNEGATTLRLVLPQDIVMNNVLPFLALPLHTFEGGGEQNTERT